MKYIDSKVKDDVITIYLKGHIDSANAMEVEKEINDARDYVAAESLILDAQDLEYISSAGLRILLRLRRELPDLKIINVSL